MAGMLPPTANALMLVTVFLEKEFGDHVYEFTVFSPSSHDDGVACTSSQPLMEEGSTSMMHLWIFTLTMGWWTFPMLMM